MPQIYSIDDDFSKLGNLLQSTNEYLKKESLKSFSYALLESIQETFLIECNDIFNKSDLEPSSLVKLLFGKIKIDFPEESFELFTRGRLFSEDAEFRWEPRNSSYTFLFFMAKDGNDEIKDFTCHKNIQLEPCLKYQYLWGKRDNGLYKDGRVPQDLLYPCTGKYVAIEIEEYWKDWFCVFSRYRKLKDIANKKLSPEG